MINEVLYICNEQEKRRIYLDDILYITVEDYLSTFILTNHEKFVCSKSLSKLKCLLPPCFFQVNRSCIINLSKIVSIKRDNRRVLLSDKSEHDVSVRRIKELNRAFTNQDITLTR